MNETIYYDLEGKVITSQEWAQIISKNGRIIAIDHIGNCTISTVFLGIDYRLGKHDGIKPIIFETNIFKDDGEYCSKENIEMYSTKEEALEGHKLAVKETKRLAKLKK